MRTHIHVALVTAHIGHAVVMVAVIHVRVVHHADWHLRCGMKVSRCSALSLSHVVSASAQTLALKLGTTIAGSAAARKVEEMFIVIIINSNE